MTTHTCTQHIMAHNIPDGGEPGSAIATIRQERQSILEFLTQLNTELNSGHMEGTMAAEVKALNEELARALIPSSAGGGGESSQESRQGKGDPPAGHQGVPQPPAGSQDTGGTGVGDGTRRY